MQRYILAYQNLENKINIDHICSYVYKAFEFEEDFFSPQLNVVRMAEKRPPNVAITCVFLFK